MEMIYELDQVDAVANALLAIRSRCLVFTFTGSLGAGKTTLIRTMLRKVGIAEPITSPTFTYVNCYINASEETFYHFDLYRIEKIQDFVNAGFDEYIYAAHSWSFIEWPQVIMPLLTKQVCHVTIEYIDQDKRKINWVIE